MQSGKNLETVVGHEITHVLEGTEFYNEMQKALYDYADAKGELQTRRKAIEDLYEGVTQDIDSELTAELVGDYLFADQDFINRLASDNRNVFQKMFDEIKYMWKQAHPSSPEAAKLEKLKRAFEKAYKESGNVKIGNTETKYALSKDANGDVFVDITEDIFDSNNGESVARTIQRVIHERFDNLVDVHGQKIQVNKTTNDEFRKSESARTLLENDTQSYNDKLKTIANADEILTAAKNWIGEEIKHIRKDDIVEFARGNVMYRVGENGYVADVIVGTRKNGAAVLYDLVNIYEKKITEGQVTMASNNSSQRRQGTSADDIISQNSEKSSVFEKKTFGNDVSVSESDTKLSLSADGDIGPVKGKDTKYSLSKNVKEDLHNALYDINYRQEVLLRDESPSIMTSQKGVNNLPMAMQASHIRENVFTEEDAINLGLRVDDHTHYHGLGEEFFLQIVDGLDNVKEAYRGTKNASDPSRRENYFLLVSEFTDKNGNTINVPVYINEHAQYNRVFIDVNKISTVFGRDSFREYINRQIKNKNLVRIKNRSTQASERGALIAPGYGMDASIHSISQNPEKSSVFEKKTFDNDFSAPEGDIIAKFSLSADEDIGPVRDDVKQKKEERINKAYERIDNKLQQDKIALEEDLATTRAGLEQQLADKSAYISNRASELYNELSNLKKGVRASKALGYLLDHGYDWNTLKSTLLKVKRWASETVNPNSDGNHRCHGFL